MVHMIRYASLGLLDREKWMKFSIFEGSVQIAPHQSFVLCLRVLPKMAMCLSVLSISLSLSGSKFLYWFDSRTSLVGILVLDKSSSCSFDVGKSSSMMSDCFVMSSSWMSYVYLPWQLVSNLTRQRQNYQETMNMYPCSIVSMRQDCSGSQCTNLCEENEQIFFGGKMRCCCASEYMAERVNIMKIFLFCTELSN